MAIKVGLMGDLYDAVYRVRGKKLAMDDKVDFVVQEYAVTAVFAVFYRKSQGNEFLERGGITRRHRMRKTRLYAPLQSL